MNQVQDFLMAYPLLENLGLGDKLKTMVDQVKVPSLIKKEKPLLASILEDLSMERHNGVSNLNSVKSGGNVIAEALKTPEMMSGSCSSSTDDNKDMQKKLSELCTPMSKKKSSNKFKPTILFNKTPKNKHNQINIK